MYGFKMIFDGKEYDKVILLKADKILLVNRKTI